jgi:ParB family transcriptional regulator, chromosome partitioning protein
MGKALEVQPELENVDISLVQGAVKAAMKDAAASSRDLWFVDRSKLRIIPNFNTRIRGDGLASHIRSLADSMKSEGFYPDKPLAGYVAKDGDEQVIYITDGHCRLEGRDLAVQEGAEIDKLPVVVSAQGTSVEDLTVALVRSNSGKPLEPYELGIVCKRLARFNWDADEIARRLGFTRTYVENLLLLISSPIGIRQMVMDGKVSATTAIDALKQFGGQAEQRLLSALDKVQQKGGERVTKKHMPAKPEVIFKKQVIKSAPVLFNTVRDIRLDDGYKQLSAELREKIDALMATLNSLESNNKEEVSEDS